MVPRQYEICISFKYPDNTETDSLKYWAFDYFINKKLNNYELGGRCL